jgi:hypothetical protein
MYFKMCLGAAKAQAQKMTRSGWAVGGMAGEPAKLPPPGGLYQCCPSFSLMKSDRAAVDIVLVERRKSSVRLSGVRSGRASVGGYISWQTISYTRQQCHEFLRPRKLACSCPGRGRRVPRTTHLVSEAIGPRYHPLPWERSSTCVLAPPIQPRLHLTTGDRACLVMIRYIYIFTASAKGAVDGVGGTHVPLS